MRESENRCVIARRDHVRVKERKRKAREREIRRSQERKEQTKKEIIIRDSTATRERERQRGRDKSDVHARKIESVRERENRCEIEETTCERA